jgi:F420-0:gamma-glutamyl ligase
MRDIKDIGLAADGDLLVETTRSFVVAEVVTSHQSEVRASDLAEEIAERFSKLPEAVELIAELRTALKRAPKRTFAEELDDEMLVHSAGIFLAGVNHE